MSTVSASQEILSPCTGVCALDPATGWCRGCRRSGAEIAAWPTMSADQRSQLLQQLDRRDLRAPRRR